MSKAAPDVDLHEQGIPRSTIVTAAVGLASLALYYYTQPSAEAGGGEEEAGDGEAEQGIVYWVLSLLWMMVKLILVLFLMLLGMLVMRQRSILYCPTPPNMKRSTKENPSSYRSPASWRVPFDDVEITTEDGVKLNAWLIYQERTCTREDDVPFTFVFFHGNAGNIGFRLENLRDMHQQLNANILIVDYRGYGDSEDGAGPCQTGFIKDAVASYKWLVDRARRPPPSMRTRIRADRLLIFGRSVGGAVGIHLFHHLLKQKIEAEAAAEAAAERKNENSKPQEEDGILPLPAGIVLENTFTSLRDMALTLFPWLAPLRWVIRPPLLFDPWNSAACLKYICSHHKSWCCCLLSGGADEIVPPEQMHQLHAILKESRPQVLKFFRFPGGGHNDTPSRGGTDYWDSFRKFMVLVRDMEQSGPSKDSQQ